jgi:hypothetical protein
MRALPVSQSRTMSLLCMARIQGNLRAEPTLRAWKNHLQPELIVPSFSLGTFLWKSDFISGGGLFDYHKACCYRFCAPMILLLSANGNELS